MYCEKCGLHPVTTHIRKTVNGVTKEWNLCTDCAKVMGYNQMSFFTGGFLGSLFEPDIIEKTADTSIRCPGCGMNFAEIARLGQVGCGECYQTFASRLTPTIEKLHGKTGHVGKNPGAFLPKKSPLEQMKEELQKAIEAQEFEQAAVLRDQIKEWEANHHEQ